MLIIYRLGFLLILLSGALRGYGQQAGPPISGQFERVRFAEFARRVEAATPYRFFYDAADVDSLTISLNATGQPLAEVLGQALAGSKLQFAVDAARHVFISTAPAIQTALPPGYFTAPAPDVAAGRPEEPAAGAGAPSRPAATRLYEVGRGQAAPAGGRATLTGRVRDARTGEPVVGAAVFVEGPVIGTATDQFGAYALTLPVGRYTVNVRGIGLRNARRQVQLFASGPLDVEVEQDITPLKEVVVIGGQDQNVSSTRMGVEKLDIKQIKQLPSVFGEADVLRAVLLLPGVKSIGEGSTGFSVRGGNTDQNLVLFNDATIYNPAHLFGFFSAFNPDAVKSVELYKSAIPAKYGGRLASVLDVETREGNRKKLASSAGIGPLTSRLTLEGPLVKDKGSFLVGGRTSYSDWLLHLAPDASLKKSAASFYDLNAHLSYDLDARNSLYATGYVSRDHFRLASDTTFEYRNTAASVKWQHGFSSQLAGVLTGTYSRYALSNSSDQNPVSASRFAYALNQTGLRADLTYYRDARHTVTFGGSSTLYRIAPGERVPLGDNSLTKTDVLGREQGLESALYAADHWDATPRLALDLGLRYSLYNALGPGLVNSYLPNVSRSESTITGVTNYGSNQIIQTYQGPEYRLAARYALTPSSSLKASAGRTRQYIHQLSNTAAMSPTDTWKLSGRYLRPQVGDQFALGYYRNFRQNTIEASVEGYFKTTRDFVDYKSGAVLILNHHIETDVLNARGRAYGVEFLLRKSTGRLNGWLSYTYARTLVQVNTATDQVNGGRYYPGNYDKPHEATLVGNYRFSRRFSTSMNVNYSTGRPITLPLAKYYVNNTLRLLYSDRNAYRVPDYFRVDMSLNIEGNHKIHKPFHSSWTVGVYNLTGRQNPYSVYYKSQNGTINGYQLSIFGSPIPTVTYNVRF
ncbi:TonB-dependent receptor [Hymenobacter psoromatis]|uniref:TonB-dependent receptor n=1 Tax=Hymenobacter psoromatis TaxID=1484116 RepID=UPI001CBC55B9|nr:TonB-dependent receptor [Hymenobacter psoromatis]